MQPCIENHNEIWISSAALLRSIKLNLYFFFRNGKQRVDTAHLPLSTLLMNSIFFVYFFSSCIQNTFWNFVYYLGTRYVDSPSSSKYKFYIFRGAMLGWVDCFNSLATTRGVISCAISLGVLGWMLFAFSDFEHTKIFAFCIHLAWVSFYNLVPIGLFALHLRSVSLSLMKALI